MTQVIIVLQIELANPAQKVVSFGAPLTIGETCTRTVKVVNHSPIALPLSVSILPSSSVPALQQEGVLTVSPTGEVTIKPNGGDFPISVTFSPKVRVPQFSEEVGRKNMRYSDTCRLTCDVSSILYLTSPELSR